MKVLLVALVAAMLLAKSRVISFDRERAGLPPRDWLVAMTHEGGAPKWEIVQDANARVLAQTSEDQTAGRFPLAIYQRAQFVNGKVSVRFKPVKGERDQAAGIVWRYQDPDNYYIVRANALEDNVVLYKVEGGKRISLEPRGTPSKTYGVKHRVPKLAWSTLAVEFRDSTFHVYFDGAKIMEVIDSTFTGAGKAGLWTKADSVTYFDDFQIERTK
jgi:hypothetical protein